jgi:hypothetical protein
MVLHFSDFSVIFYAIYKNQQTHFYYFSCAFAAGTLGRFLFSQCGPWALWPAWAGQIPAMRRRIPAGEGRRGI